MKTIYVETDVPGELSRVEREVADHRGRPVLVVFPEVREIRDGAVEALTDILTGDAPLGVLLTKPIPEELGIPILDSGCPLYVTPRARIGSPGTSGTELSAIGAATLVQTPKHAAELLQAAWLAGELTRQAATTGDESDG